MERYEPDETVTGVGAWSRVPHQLAVGTRFDLEGLSVARAVRDSGGPPVRLDSFAGATGGIAREAHGLGIRSSVGCPIVVAGKLWGVIAASTRSDEPFPADTESQMARFTELVATAVENAEARAELRRVADEQAALRRVATLVSRGVAPDVVFAAVAREVGQLTRADSAVIFRFDTDGMATLVNIHGLGEDGRIGIGIGLRWKPEPPTPVASFSNVGPIRPIRRAEPDVQEGTYPDPGSENALGRGQSDHRQGSLLGRDQRRVAASPAPSGHRAAAGRVH
jgi:GAF domain-containing protein